MKPLAEIVWQRLTGLMPGELKKAELPWLATPFQHLSLLANRRATMIVNRVRLFAFLFAVLTPMWIVVDFLVFASPLWWQLALMRVLASAAFASLVLFYQPRGNLLDAYRAMALLFLIPTLFYVASYNLMGAHELVRERVLHAEDGTGYQFSQARGLLVLDSPVGLVAVLPVGMCQVSSVVMTADVGVKLRKGEEFAYFQFGGSDVVMLFESSVNAGLIMQPGVHYKQGSWIGHAFPG